MIWFNIMVYNSHLFMSMLYFWLVTHELLHGLLAIMTLL